MGDHQHGSPVYVHWVMNFKPSVIWSKEQVSFTSGLVIVFFSGYFQNVWFVYGEEGGGARGGGRGDPGRREGGPGEEGGGAQEETNSWTCLALVAMIWNYKGGVEEGLLLGFAISLGQRKWYKLRTNLALCTLLQVSMTRGGNSCCNCSGPRQSDALENWQHSKRSDIQNLVT